MQAEDFPKQKALLKRFRLTNQPTQPNSEQIVKTHRPRNPLRTPQIRLKRLTNKKELKHQTPTNKKQTKQNKNPFRQKKQQKPINKKQNKTKTLSAKKKKDFFRGPLAVNSWASDASTVVVPRAAYFSRKRKPKRSGA